MSGRPGPQVSSASPLRMMMDDEFKSDLLFYGLLLASGITASVSVYLLVRYYFPAGKVMFGNEERSITQEDKLWAARMVVGETGTDPQAGAAVLWSVLTRWGTKPTFSGMTWTQVMRAFSQPINPSWSSLAAEGCQRSPQACTEAHLERRRQISSMPWSNIPQSVQELVETFAQGRVANPIPGYNNFASSGAISGSSRSSSELPAVTIGGNTFIRDPGSLQQEVRIV